MPERFWSKVAIGEPDQCWEWQASRDKQGYGQIKLGGVVVKAHRASYELSTGTSVGNLDVLHSCDNPSCCNPSHLVPGTHQDNMDDMYSKGRRKAASGESHGNSKLSDASVAGMRED